ncbi:MAG TPA: YcjF family protein, partial [Gammaproteobacteria bacterium]|nr:YcjF family protein [Gammaproteobacteria bacterium]
YSAAELDTLTRHLDERVRPLLGEDRVVPCSAAPAPRTVVVVDANGHEREHEEARPADVARLVERVWDIVERDGRALAALNAGLFAGRLSDRVSARVTELRRGLARRLTDNYALAKGIAVAVNPVPAADLAGAAALDVTLIVHLGRLYGFPVTRREAGRLVVVIVGQLSALLGTVWSVNLFASVLKAGTGGLSTALTAGAQGAVGYASTWILGRVAEDYFRRGGGWGQQGPKQAVEAVLAGVDRDSLLAQARAEIRRALRTAD